MKELGTMFRGTEGMSMWNVKLISVKGFSKWNFMALIDVGRSYE